MGTDLLSITAVICAVAFWIHLLLLITKFIQKVRPVDRLFLVTSFFLFSLIIIVIIKKIAF